MRIFRRVLRDDRGVVGVDDLIGAALVVGTFAVIGLVLGSKFQELNAVNKALGKIRKFLSDCTGGTRMEGMETA